MRENTLEKEQKEKEWLANEKVKHILEKEDEEGEDGDGDPKQVEAKEEEVKRLLEEEEREQMQLERLKLERRAIEKERQEKILEETKWRIKESERAAKEREIEERRQKEREKEELERDRDWRKQERLRKEKEENEMSHQELDERSMVRDQILGEGRELDEKEPHRELESREEMNSVQREKAEQLIAIKEQKREETKELNFSGEMNIKKKDNIQEDNEPQWKKRMKEDLIRRKEEREKERMRLYRELFGAKASTVANQPVRREEGDGSSEPNVDTLEQETEDDGKLLNWDLTVQSEKTIGTNLLIIFSRKLSSFQ